MLGGGANVVQGIVASQGGVAANLGEAMWRSSIRQNARFSRCLPNYNLILYSAILQVALHRLMLEIMCQP